MEAEPGRLRFRGKKSELVCKRVVAMNLVRPPVPFLSIIVVAILLIGAPSVGLFRYLTWNNPLTIPLIAGLFGCYCLLVLTTRWIEVEYRERGNVRKAYFLNGKAAVAAGLFGATRRLYGQLRAAVLPSEGTT